MKDISNLEADPGKPGWYLGFVVVNPVTNVVYDIYPGQLEAIQEAKRLGNGFKSFGGSYCPKTDTYEYFQSVLMK